jgi:hypothetical protein
LSEATGVTTATTTPARADKRRAHAKQQARKKKVRGRSVGIGHNLPSALLDDRCLTFREWCQLNGIGARTGRRILDGPDPPTITQLSPRRIGITVRNNRIWQTQRARNHTDTEA